MSYDIRLVGAPELEEIFQEGGTQCVGGTREGLDSSREQVQELYARIEELTRWHDDRTRERDEARADEAESERIRDGMRDLLVGVAAGLKGDPPPNVLHDWSQLPRLAGEMRAEVERLRGLRPSLPPLPPTGSGLPRYGLRWNGPDQPIAVPMEDGYWTPWHLAENLRALGAL